MIDAHYGPRPSNVAFIVAIIDQLVPVTLITWQLFTIGVGAVIGLRRSLVYHDIEEERYCVNIATVASCRSTNM